MIRNAASRMLIWFSLLIASFSWSGFVAQRTTLNVERSDEVAQTIVESPVFQDFVSQEIVERTKESFPLVEGLGDDTLSAFADEAVQDEGVQGALVQEIVDLHRQIVEGDIGETVSLDGQNIGNAGGEFLTEQSPFLGDLVGSDLDIPIEIDTSGLGWVPILNSVLDVFVPIGLLTSSIGLVAGFVIAKDKKWPLRRVAIWAGGISIFWLAIGLGLPRVLGGSERETLQLASAVSTALFRTMITPGIVMGVIALVLLAVSFFIVGAPEPVEPLGTTASGPFSDMDREPFERIDPQPYREPYADERDAPQYRDPLPPREPPERI